MGTQGGSHGSLSHWLPPSSEDAEQQQPMLSQVDEVRFQPGCQGHAVNVRLQGDRICDTS